MKDDADSVTGCSRRREVGDGCACVAVVCARIEEARGGRELTKPGMKRTISITIYTQLTWCTNTESKKRESTSPCCAKPKQILTNRRQSVAKLFRESHNAVLSFVCRVVQKLPHAHGTHPNSHSTFPELEVPAFD